MGLFNFKKVNEVKFEIKEERKDKPLSYLKEDVSLKLKDLNNEIYNEEEAKKQMLVLIDHLPFIKQEKDFRDDLRRELYLTGYERQCDNGEEELADEVALTDLEVSIFEKINKEMLSGAIVSLKKQFVNNNILKIVDRIKLLTVKEKVSAELEKRAEKEIDIMKVIEDIQEEINGRD